MPIKATVLLLWARPLVRGAVDILEKNASLYDYYTQPIALFVNRTIYEVIWGWDDPLLEFGEANGASLTAACAARPIRIPHPACTTVGPIIGSPIRYPGLQGNDSSAEHALATHSPSSMYCSTDAGARKFSAEEVWHRRLLRDTATRRYSFCAVLRYYIEWDGSSELLCCPFGVCGDAGSGKGATRPWATESAETITGSFGDVFHSFVSQDETLYVSSHDFGEYRWWPMVRTWGSMFCASPRGYTCL